VLDWLRTGAERPCVILLDFMMPRMDGLQLRTELLNDPQLALIPVVVLSADPSAIVAAKSVNFAGSLRSKPVPLDALLGAVHAHCA
jgi:CheY-like chemotaxis protein